VIEHPDGPEEEKVVGWDEIKNRSSAMRISQFIDDDTQPSGPQKRKVTYIGPFDKCDREADYATTWIEMEKRYAL
jgi:hypothetical protein